MLINQVAVLVHLLVHNKTRDRHANWLCTCSRALQVLIGTEEVT